MDEAEAKTPQVSPEEEVPSRAVVFPDAENEIYEEKIHHGHHRPKGVEMKREMTKEDKELAAAGYEHLEEEKIKEQEKGDFDNVDIQEHRLSLLELAKSLDTQFDTKDPVSSAGLSSDEAKARLSRDGPNVLTPPKKKSALRKVRTLLTVESDSMVSTSVWFLVLRLPHDYVQYPVDLLWYP